MSDAGGLVYSRRFRFAVVLVVVGMLWWFLLGVLERETRNAEERAANMVIGQLKSALVIKGAEVMLSREGHLAEHRGINPFELVEHQWGNYVGKCGAQPLAPATWCFRASKQKETVNGRKGWFIYRSGQAITVDSRQTDGQQLLAWRVTTEFADRNGNGVREQDERLTGLRLSPMPLTEEMAGMHGVER